MATKKASKLQSSGPKRKKALKKNADKTPENVLASFLDKYVNKPKGGSPVGPRLEALLKAVQTERIVVKSRLTALDQLETAARKFDR